MLPILNVSKEKIIDNSAYIFFCEKSLHDTMSRGNPEKPTRTLFIRNIPYTTNEEEVRQLFSPFGDIKLVFSLIQKRGLAFVTYVSSQS